MVLLFPGEASTTAAGQDWPGPGSQPSIVGASLTALRWLDTLGVRATAALGHGVGEITGLVWAGSLSEADAAGLVAQRAAVLAAPGARRTALICLAADADSALALEPGGQLVIAAHHGPRCHVLGGPADPVHDVARRAAEEGIQAYVLDVPHALHSPAMADRVTPLRGVLAGVTFAAPGRRLISTVSGQELTSAAGFPDLLCDQLVSPVRFAEALGEADLEADLLLDTGPGQAMAALAAGCSTVPAVSLASGPGSPPAQDAAAALFATGAIDTLSPLLAGRPSRPIDTGRDRVFITNPYALATAELAGLEEPQGGQDQDGRTGGRTERAGSGRRHPHGRDRPQPVMPPLRRDHRRTSPVAGRTSRPAPEPGQAPSTARSDTEAIPGVGPVGPLLRRGAARPAVPGSAGGRGTLAAVRDDPAALRPDGRGGLRG